MTDIFLDNVAVLLLELIVLCLVFGAGTFICDWLEDV